MDRGDQLVRRAYTLIEAGVPAYDAIEDLLTLAQGDFGALQAALDRVEGQETLDVGEYGAMLEQAGFAADLADIAITRQNALRSLLRRTVATGG